MTNRAILFFLPAALLAACTATRENSAPVSDVIFADYQELPDPDTVAAAGWEELDEPMYVSFASTDKRYSKSHVPGAMINISKKAGNETLGAEFSFKGNLLSWQGIAWKGERVNLQALLWATEDISNVRVNVSDLTSEEGGVIASSAVEPGFVRYVMTDEFAGGCGKRKPADFDSSLVADVIDVIPVMDVPAKTVRPVWIQVEVPQDAAPGMYTGTISFDNQSDAEVSPLTVRLRVVDHTLPPPSEWTFHLDLWQNPFAESRVYGVENWSPEHFEAMKPSMEMLADAGQKIITASIIHDPWNSQTYDIYESMVRWIKKKDGSWEYDYSVFDKWVDYMSGLGIDQQINCYSMVPWNLKFYYYDETLGRDTVIVAEPGTPEYDAHWRPMLESFAAHLKEKGWFEKTTIAMDERPLKAMQAVIKLVKSVDDDFKISLAGNYHSEIVADIYDYCIGSGQHIGADTVQQRRDKGKKTTYYTCCVEAYPNTFTFSPPAESTWLALHSAAKGYDGYLRWAYNCWVKDPLHDSRFRAWPAGDTYLVYPGGRSSIRFEKMIDGIEDYVKVRILREELTEAGNTDVLKKLDASLEPFKDISKLATVPAGDMVEEVRDVLNGY